MKIFASINPDTEVRLKSSSGGAFSQIASTVIAEGGRVYGVTFGNDWSLKYAGVAEWEELEHLRGSKYAFAPLDSIFKSIECDLEDGRIVLFSGTPCHIAAARKKFGSPERLILLELVCHGAPKHEYWMRYLDGLLKRLGKTKQDIASISFRDKCSGWKDFSFAIAFKDGARFCEPFGRNLYMQTFLWNYTLRDGCFKCPFKYPSGSKADISLGDLWGANKLHPTIDDDLGVSLVIARTELGEAWTKGLPISAVFSLEDVAKYNPALVRSADKPLYFDHFNRVAGKMELLSAMEKELEITFFKKLKTRVLMLLQRFSK